MKCHNCPKPAMFAVGPSNVPLCLDCNLKLTQINAIQTDQMQRELNYLTDEMESIVGLPGTLPKYPERQAVQVHGATFNNIQIKDSAVGMINTGAIETVDTAITAINMSGEPKLGKAIAEFCQAVVADGNLDDATKDKLLEALSFVSTEATAPRNQRRSFAIRPVIEVVANLLGGSAALAALWDRVKPIIDAAFE